MDWLNDFGFGNLTEKWVEIIFREIEFHEFFSNSSLYICSVEETKKTREIQE